LAIPDSFDADTGARQTEDHCADTDDEQDGSEGAT